MRSTVFRTPAELAADLASLRRTHWARLWSDALGEDPWEWCEQFGWELTAFFRGNALQITLDTGADWELVYASRTGNATSLEAEVWEGYDDDARSVTAETLAQWGTYLAVVSEALGSPGYHHEVG